MKIKMFKTERDFDCIAGACPDSCCIGWCFPVDKKSAELYEDLTGKAADDIRESLFLDDEGDLCFGCTEDGRCKHLKEDGLCRIISELGDGYIPDICDRHPRFYNLCGSIKEGGLGLSCPVSVDLLFDTPTNLLCEVEQIEKPRLSEKDISESMYSPACEEKILELREVLFSMLEDCSDTKTAYKKILGVADKLIHASDLADDYEEIFLEKTTEEIISDVKEVPSLGELRDILIEAFSSLEYLGGEIEILANIVNKDLQNNPSLDEIPFEKYGDTPARLLICFIQRYLISGLEDASCGASLRLAVMLSVMLILIIERAGGDLRCTVRKFSQSVEYSPDNIELLKELSFAFK